MRILMWHVDFFKCAVTEKGRSPVVEDPDPRVTEVSEALVVFAAVEKADEESPQSAVQGTVREIADLSEKLSVETVVLHPFAHLFGDLSRPSTAVKILKQVEGDLLARGLKALRTPFGWFNTLEIRAKGHPLSRVARSIPAGMGSGGK